MEIMRDGLGRLIEVGESMVVEVHTVLKTKALSLVRD